MPSPPPPPTGSEEAKRLFEAIAGYGLGGSSIAMFGRVGGTWRRVVSWGVLCVYVCVCVCMCVCVCGGGGGVVHRARNDSWVTGH